MDYLERLKCVFVVSHCWTHSDYQHGVITQPPFQRERPITFLTLHLLYPAFVILKAAVYICLCVSADKNT